MGTGFIATVDVECRDEAQLREIEMRPVCACGSNLTGSAGAVEQPVFRVEAQFVRGPDLWVALDALLAEHSVTRAAERLATSLAAMSRTLSRLRRGLVRRPQR